jgi:hypothetical protein
MSTRSLEARVAELEAELSRLKQRVETQQTPRSVAWWERRFGAFKDDPLYEDAMRLGREYRESLHAEDDAA